MKSLLIPLLASLALPTAVHAESYWLVIKTSVCGRSLLQPCGTALEKIEMKSLAQCEANGELWLDPYRNRMRIKDDLEIVKSTKEHKEKGYLWSSSRGNESFSYICLTGK